MKFPWRFSIIAAILSLVLAACGTGGSGTTTPGASASDEGSASASASGGTAADDCGVEALGGEPVALDFQLQWVPQAQFAGYFAAKDLGYYEDAGLDVTLLDGGPDIAPQQVVAADDGPELGEGWVP